jgi:hypothetical protein
MPDASGHENLGIAGEPPASDDLGGRGGDDARASVSRPDLAPGRGSPPRHVHGGVTRLGRRLGPGGQRVRVASYPSIARARHVGAHGLVFDSSSFLDCGAVHIARGPRPQHLRTVVCRKRITPLHPEASLTMADLFLANSAEIEARSRTEETPLLVQAAEAEAEDVMAVLLKAGAHVNATGGNGRSALDIAIAREEESKAALLRRYGGRIGRPR